MLKTGAPKMLIYTLTKNAACKVYELLSKSVHNKQCVGMYHASLSPATKTPSFRKMELCVAWSQPLLLVW